MIQELRCQAFKFQVSPYSETKYILLIKNKHPRHFQVPKSGAYRINVIIIAKQLRISSCVSTSRYFIYTCHLKQKKFWGHKVRHSAKLIVADATLLLGNLWKTFMFVLMSFHNSYIHLVLENAMYQFLGKASKETKTILSHISQIKALQL